MRTRLEDLDRCFQGIVPSVIATASADGEPNVTYLSQVHYVDQHHVALSCQFFNKTKRNVGENPHVSIVFYDPVSFEAWRLCGRFERSETDGALFDKMSARIDVIASHTGMAGVFRLLSADVYEVLSLEKVDGYLAVPHPALDAPRIPDLVPGPLTELRGLQVVSERIARACDLNDLMDGTLTAMDELLGFSNSMVFLLDASGEVLQSAAQRGYDGARPCVTVRVGSGLIGTVAAQRRLVHVSGMGSELRYGRAIRRRLQESSPDRSDLVDEIPLPGLGDAQVQLAIPLLAGTRLVGVLAVESQDPLCFDDWDETFLQIVANQIALAIDRMQVSSGPTADPSRRTHKFVFYRNDECIFVDGEYLVRNVPGRILWKLLGRHHARGRAEFTNRELRLDPSLRLPAHKDNLESRLILLRQRLAERCPDVRMVSVRRGRFALELDCDVHLEERETA